MSNVPPDTLQKLLAQKRRLDAQIQRITAKARQAERKADTRRKIVAGAVMLKAAAQNAEVAALVRRCLDRQLSAARDRALFDLPALPETQNDNATIQ